MSDCVINYDIPEENEYYIHRIGRTGRAKKDGRWPGPSWATFPEQAKLDEIAKYAHFADQAHAVRRGRRAGGKGDPQARPPAEVPLTRGRISEKYKFCIEIDTSL